MINQPQIILRIKRLLCYGSVLLVLGIASPSHGQTEDAFGDDPIKLFERAQNAHGRGELAQALELYDEAIKLRPEFPEAEFQRANVLVSLKRFVEAETGLRRAIELRKNWSLPYAVMGSLLLRMKREQEAETFLRQSLKIDANSSIAMQALAEIRLRAGDGKEALALAQKAASDPNAPVTTLFVLALAQRGNGDNATAAATLNRIVESDPTNVAALLERAEIRIALGQKEDAIKDIQAAELLIKDDKASSARLAAAYELAGRRDDARRIGLAAGLVTAATQSTNARGVVGTPEEIEAANSGDPEVSRKALEALIQKNPSSAMLKARLGQAYRTIDPARSLEYYRQAMELEPRNAEYATGYGSALVQARRFGDAAAVLRQVVSAAPDNYAAHANLATALYGLKRYAEALTEYQWLLNAKPDLTIAHYFIATAHDFLGEYKQALPAYEAFMAKANPATNQLEIEKVKLRLPLLRRQIQLGEGVKQKAEKRKQ